MIYYGQDPNIIKWASQICFGFSDGWDDSAKIISIFKNEKLIAAVIYTNYYEGISVEMSIASIDKRWATRHNLKAFFKYPFIDLGVKRVTTLCSAKERDIIMFNKRLGFKPEGYHREAHHNGEDAVSFGMLKNECKWIEGC